MTPHRYLTSYDRGHLTASEVAERLINLVAEHPPADYGGDVPEPILDVIRRRTEVIPNPEEVIIFRFGPGYGKGTPEERAEQERYVAGLRTWKAYFESVERVIPPTGERS